MLYCPTCGNEHFSCLDLGCVVFSDASDDTRYQCADCKTVFSKAELLAGNQDIINANIEEIKQEAIDDLKKQFKKMFK